MADLKSIKTSIENNTYQCSFTIFKYSNVDFIPYQYVNEISKQRNLSVEIVEDLALFTKPATSIFGGSSISDSILYLYIVDKFECLSERISRYNNLIVICKTIDKDTEKLFQQYIVSVPKLEDWQIADYVYSLAEGVDTKLLDSLIKVCNNDIYRLDQELKKIKIFDKQERNFVFNQFIEDGNWDEAKNYYNKVLDINPKCSSAYLIAAMIDIKAKDRQGLVQYEGQIEENNNFIKAIRFGSEEEKKYLKGIVTEAENVRTKIQFDKAISLMKSNNIRQLTEARNILTRLNNNYDVHNELKQCEKRIAQLSKKRRVTILISLASIAFVVIGSLLLKFIILPYGTYKKACNLLSEEHYTEAIELFESIDNYLDSEERIQECKYQYANKFKVGDEIIFGKTGLDLDIDLVWNVIKREDNKALIISKKCIYPEVFNEDLDNSWENSTIRYKLNQMLINSFTDEEKMAIVINEEDISDSIFLLSLEEAEEMGEDIDRVGYLNKKSCDWWLRTGDGELKVRYVDKYGKIRRGERTSKMKSIRPAMWISLDKVSK